ncbi:MAG TPA: hypothetical protein VLV90_01920 [Burkholderiales bacterium]|nr:hypothetical protein [Burkholderiales bacterium]
MSFHRRTFLHAAAASAVSYSLSARAGTPIFGRQVTAKELRSIPGLPS